MVLISVIVPVYNVEKYIHQCIDSILSQTFTDFELILVDDGSPDQCPQICDRYVEQDQRIHVIHQKNGGLSAARNAGIDWAFANSDSQWITFIDSDDWVHPELLERLYLAAVNRDTSVSVCGYIETAETETENDIGQLSPELWDAESFYAQKQVESAPVQLWTPEDFYVQYNVNASVAWGKLYKKECFSKIRYPIGKIHEDEFITYKILFEHKKIAFIDAPLYAYFSNPNGIMKTKWRPERLCGIEARMEQIAYFSENHFELARNRAIKGLLWGIKGQLEAVIFNNEKEYITYLRKMLRKEIRQYKKILMLSPSNTSDLYELAYPVGMAMYWRIKSLLKK